MHRFQFCVKDRWLFHTNSKVFGVGKIKYAIWSFKGAKGVAMATKFWAKINKKNAKISVLRKKRGLFHTDSKVFGVCEFKYAIWNSQGAKGVAMATKIGQK